MLTLEQSLAALSAIDFTNVKRKLCEPEPEGKGYHPKDADLGEKWYRRFLELHLRYPDAPIVPNGTIDEFWHKHILDTEAYAKDCEAVFGHFLHHYPYYGMNGDADQRDVSYDETNALYIKHFGEDCRNCVPTGDEFDQMVEMYRKELTPENLHELRENVVANNREMIGKSCRSGPYPPSCRGNSCFAKQGIMADDKSNTMSVDGSS